WSFAGARWLTPSPLVHAGSVRRGRRTEPDDRRPWLIVDEDRPERTLGGVSVDGGDGGHLLPEIAHHRVHGNQRNRRPHTGDGQCGREIQRADAGMSVRRAQDQTLELVRMPDV